MTLRVFTDGTDKVIAEDLHDVRKVIESHTGSWEGNFEDWVALPDDRMLTINTVELEPPAKVTKTCAEWVKSEGRGFLCSTEY